MKKNSIATDIAYVAVFTALVIVLAFVSIPVGTAGVPIVLQNAALILAGLVLGGRRGLFVGLLFLFLGLALPVLAGGGTTLRALAGPTAGYIIGYIISPAVTGLIAYRAPRNKAGMAITLTLAAIVGLFIQYSCGVVGLMVRSGLDLGAAIGANVAFLLPDTAKLVVAVIIALGVHSAFPDLMGRRPRASQAPMSAQPEASALA
ncbi:biotin transporter BioY [Corynebacterium lizhenjunii]|uniref:Biotin transporter n=1 Tax=Corynebacterium lizhenjunii TaxID=2709394 RepID=A0A7T0KCR1_9CORY|nr:biotin transporter BioY [Corynebacterium lizhenjunii]QPK78368.1 biotin transporter BioY [Corynebacterium lizhenjunii]